MACFDLILSHAAVARRANARERMATVRCLCRGISYTAPCSFASDPSASSPARKGRILLNSLGQSNNVFGGRGRGEIREGIFGVWRALPELTRRDSDLRRLLAILLALAAARAARPH